MIMIMENPLSSQGVIVNDLSSLNISKIWPHNYAKLRFTFSQGSRINILNIDS